MIGLLDIDSKYPNIALMKLKELGVDPFVMPFNKKDPYQKKFARWVNMKAIFKTVKWGEYK